MARGGASPGVRDRWRGKAEEANVIGYAGAVARSSTELHAMTAMNELLGGATQWHAVAQLGSDSGCEQDGIEQATQVVAQHAEEDVSPPSTSAL